MKRFFFFLLIGVSLTVFSQQTNYNINKGYVAEGYDVVSYFTQNKAVKGKSKYTTTYDSVQFKFSSKEHLQLFKAKPKKYIPQYGGYCAYAIGATGDKVGINPKTFEIREEKLYLFYNAWGTNTLKLWTKEGAEKLKNQADKNWKKYLKTS